MITMTTDAVTQLKGFLAEQERQITRRVSSPCGVSGFNMG